MAKSQQRRKAERSLLQAVVIVSPQNQDYYTIPPPTLPAKKRLILGMVAPLCEFCHPQAALEAATQN
jgi:hypothetical protein